MSLFGLAPSMEEEEDETGKSRASSDESSSSEEEDEGAVQSRERKRKTHFHPTFSFASSTSNKNALETSTYQALANSARVGSGSSLDEKIAAKRALNTRTEEVAANPSDEEEEDSDDNDDSNEEGLFQVGKEISDRMKTKERKQKSRKSKSSFFDAEASERGVEAAAEEGFFHEMALSRPLLKALTAMAYAQPTPIQRACIPLALEGRDICACAATGTGKTGAFMLPILERLLYKPSSVPTTRVLILLPTRELAIQVFQVARQLAQFTQVSISLSTGGLDVAAQEAALRARPDVVIATPGRLIDHVHNSPAFSLADIEVLVLDEADRMLDEFFAEQMKEVIRLCAVTRQTLLFSATMSDEVEDLAAVSLRKPARIFVNENTEVAVGLRQEFVRIRGGREGDREPLLLALLTRSFLANVIVFVQTKKQCHRLHVLLGLLGIRVGELHGSLSQLQRMDALKRFKEETLDVLLCTDLAARGLDIPAVKTVINFTLPPTMKQYIHRVGRTARAGRSGRSVSLVGEGERKLLREILKTSTGAVKQRVIAAEVVSSYAGKVGELESTVAELEAEEAAEKELRAAEASADRAERRMQGSKEEKGSSKRGWFQTRREREAEAAKGRLSRRERKKAAAAASAAANPAERRAMAELEKSAAFAARAAKRSNRPQRMRAVGAEPKDAHAGRGKAKANRSQRKAQMKGGGRGKQKRGRGKP